MKAKGKGKAKKETRSPSKLKKMKTPKKWSVGGIEENTLAILDSTEAKDSRDAHDDRIAFLDAVRTTSIVRQQSTPPTEKIYDAIFGLLRMANSLETVISSFNLLTVLIKRFPPVCFSNANDLIVDKEAWSPFIAISDGVHSLHEKESSAGPLDSSSFHLLIQELAETTDESKFPAPDVKFLSRILLFQHLVNFVELDFLPRIATEIWNFQRESVLNILLASRKINFKGFVKDCLAVICRLSRFHNGFQNQLKQLESIDGAESSNALAIVLVEEVKNTCSCVQKLLTMIMELDMRKKKADAQGYTTRADGNRTPLLDVILDEMTYSEDALFAVFQAFDQPKWKLEMVLNYLWKYLSKPAVRTRRSNDSSDDATFIAALKAFSSNNTAKGLIKKINAEVVQLLLAHGFQAQLSLLFEGQNEERKTILQDLCNMFIAAFKSLRSADKQMEILQVGKEALFVAATSISMKHRDVIILTVWRLEDWVWLSLSRIALMWLLMFVFKRSWPFAVESTNISLLETNILGRNQDSTN